MIPYLNTLKTNCALNIVFSYGDSKAQYGDLKQKLKEIYEFLYYNVHLNFYIMKKNELYGKKALFEKNILGF